MATTPLTNHINRVTEILTSHHNPIVEGANSAKAELHHMEGCGCSAANYNQSVAQHLEAGQSLQYELFKHKAEQLVLDLHIAQKSKATLQAQKEIRTKLDRVEQIMFDFADD